MKKEATVVMCGCQKHKGQVFGIRFEKFGGEWLATWAFPLDSRKASHENYDKNTISGNFGISDEYPGCPYCGNKVYYLCGDCGHLNCNGLGQNYVTCSFCGSSGELNGIFDSLDNSFDM